jgi:hypothetical protein
LTHSSEFKVIFKEAMWTDKVMTLQLRTRLNGEIKDVYQLANKKRIRNPQKQPG